MQYRREIDGLRAVAVVSVVLYHAGLLGLSGGFVGVDVFFVISGFLITTIIQSEINAGHFSILAFYDRRIRRILPALVVVVACCVPFAFWLMPPFQLTQFGHSVAAVAAFVSNVLFWREVGYFAPAAATKPLLHTWSLAIEEQFYVVFPLLLAGLARLPRYRKAILAAMLVASFAFAVWGFPNDPAARFLLIPSRAWELLCGAGVALALLQDGQFGRRRPLLQNVAAGLALALIVLSCFVLDETWSYPGVATLAPVLGTVGILLCATEETVAGRLLAASPMVAVGLVSYSAYLWHQPILSFLHLGLVHEPGPALRAAGCGLAFALGALSWALVERPFRNRAHFSRRTILTLGLVSSGMVAAVGGVIAAGHGFTSRFTAPELAAFAPPHTEEVICDATHPLAAFPKVSICPFGAVDHGRPVVLWGDSHAQALFGALDEKLKAAGRGGWFVRNGYCRTITTIYEVGKFTTSRRQKCEASQEALVAYLKQAQPAAIVVALRWTFQLYPVPGEIEDLSFDNGEGGRESETFRQYAALTPEGHLSLEAAVKTAAVERFLAELAGVGRLIIQYPVPEVGWDVPALNFKSLRVAGALPPEISTSFARFQQRNHFVTGVLDGVAGPDVQRVYPAAHLCQEASGRCLAQVDGVPLYFDDDHLSLLGARPVAADILEKLP
jgi:peptidoglycan/LPS O-acetylase OafA/YrhL